MNRSIKGRALTLVMMLLAFILFPLLNSCEGLALTVLPDGRLAAAYTPPAPKPVETDAKDANVKSDAKAASKTTSKKDTPTDAKDSTVKTPALQPVIPERGDSLPTVETS